MLDPTGSAGVGGILRETGDEADGDAGDKAESGGGERADETRAAGSTQRAGDDGRPAEEN